MIETSVGNKIKKKIVIASSPFTETTAPIMVPALFKSILEKAGFDSVGIDLNAEVYSRICDEPDFDEYLRFFYYDVVSDGFELKIKELFEYAAGKILQHSPDIVCLSLLHYQCQNSTKWLCFYLKKINPEIQIIIGGAGAFGHGLLTNEGTFTSMLKELGLIDHYVSGDGDIAIIELLNGNTTYPGVNSLTWEPIKDLNSIPYPNYDDYNFEIYKSPFIGVLGSRGCVRQCTFCDIHEFWEKFIWRTAESIFEEMMTQHKKYGIRYFKFQDSLVNGNVKEYNKLIALLADYNNRNPDKSIHWSSHFIFRPSSQMSEEQWRLTAESGGDNLYVGIESLVEKNRDHIGKKFSNADIDYGLMMAKKYNIKLVFLLLVGYVTETHEDHLVALQWIRENKHYANDPLKSLAIGGTLGILPGTKLWRAQSELGVTWNTGRKGKHSGENSLWEIKAIDNNYETRIRRLNEMLTVGQENGFSVNYSIVDPQKELENLIKEQMSND